MDELLLKHFPQLSNDQLEKFNRLPGLYEDWNSKINVISRKDIEHFAERHVLHSLALSFYWSPSPGQRVIDIGTGGGFPGIPLAILFPQVEFLLVDSIGKKINVVNEVIEALSLKNARGVQNRAEDIRGKYDTALSRAVARLEILVKYCTEGRFKVKSLYCLKGGDLQAEQEEIDRYPSIIYPLDKKLSDPFFETKKVVRVDF